MELSDPGSSSPVGSNSQESRVSSASHSTPLLPSVMAPGSNGAGATPAQSSSALNVWTVLAALRRRWALGTSLGIVGAIIAAAATWYVMPSKYVVRSQLRVLTVVKTPVGPVDVGTDFANYQRAQIAMLRSRLVFNTALRDSKVAALPIVQQHQADPIAWLDKEFQADFAAGPELLTLSMGGNEPAQLIVVVNALREAYLKEVVNKEKIQRLGQLDQLKKFKENWDDMVRTKQNRLQSLAKPLGSKDAGVLAFKNQYALSQMNMLQSDLLGLQRELRTADLQLKAELQREKAGTDLVVPNDLIEEAMSRDATLGKALAEIAQMEEYLADFKKKAAAGENHPKYKMEAAKLAAARKQLAADQALLRSQLTEEYKERMRLANKSRIAELNERIDQLKHLEKTLNAEIETRSKDMHFMSENTLEVEALRDEIELNQGVAKTLAAKVQNMELELDAPDRIFVQEEAYIAQTPDPKRTLRMAGMASGAAFFGILFGICFWEIQARKINSSDEVVQALGMKLVGSLPVMPARATRQSGGVHSARDLYWHNLLVESVDAARTNLLHMARLESVRVVMVTSATGGEGKTLLSTHLAASLVRAGCRTLLIDGDLRSPSIHRLLDLPVGPGFGELLRGEAVSDEVALPGPVEGLSVIPAGECDAETLRALAHGNLAALFQQLKTQYDFIVVDSAPVLPVADSLLIGQHVDGVLFSILRDVSRLPSVGAAQERLAMLDIRLLGAVVNGVPTSYSRYTSRYTMSTVAETESPA